MRVNVVCRNYQDDRVLPRFARHIAERNSWALSKKAVPGYDVTYYMAYFEHQITPDFDERLVSYFTHLEDQLDSEKVKLYNRVAKKVWLRVAMNESQLPHLRQYGKSVVFPLPLERDRFRMRGNYGGGRPVLGFSGYTYKSGRKGEDKAKRLTEDFGNRAEFMASGRGWPGRLNKYTWAQMPDFYRGLDLFICTSLVEGGPMTTLEALSCGVPVVIPDSVGVHPQIPETAGIYRYKTGDYKGLKRAVGQALVEIGKHDRQALRDATRPHGIDAFCRQTLRLFERELYDKPKIPALPEWEGKAGVYVVAFGEPARDCAKRCIKTVQKHMKVPVALCSDRPLGPENILIRKPDADIGGRKAKLHAYDYAPADWKYVLYMDADAYAIAPDPTVYFDWLADGWEFVICKDAHLHDTVRHFQRRTNIPETNATIAKMGTDETLLINGGVWAFRRNGRTKKFFDRWFREWDKNAGRDQGALLRALYHDPLRTYWLGNHWNTLVTQKGQEYPPKRKGSAGIIHEVGEARRWEGQIPGRIDSPVAWQAVERWGKKHGKDGRRHPRKRKIKA